MTRKLKLKNIFCNIPMFGTRRPLFGYWRTWGASLFGHRIHRVGWFKIGRKTYYGGNGKGGTIQYNEFQVGWFSVELKVIHGVKYP